MPRKCDHCGAAFEAKRSTAKFCGSSCRGKAAVARKHAPTSPETAPTSALQLLPPGPVQVATMAELRTVGRLDTALGQAAIALAIWLDMPGCTSPSSVARELRATLAEATRGAKKAATSPQKLSDELAERRARRGA